MSIFARKYYEYGDVTCDMRNPRKRFFAVMCGDVQLADIEPESNFYTDGRDRVYVYMVGGFSVEAYTSLLHILSEITKDNEIHVLDFIGLKMIESDDFAKEFPKYRRKKQYGMLVRVREFYASTPDNFRIAAAGHFFMLNKDKMIIVNEHEYKKLLDIDNTITPLNKSVMPDIIFKAGDVKCSYDHNRFYIDDTDILGDSTILMDYENAIEFYINRDDMNHKKIKLPKVENPYEGEISFHFYDRALKKIEPLTADMFDFSNLKGYECSDKKHHHDRVFLKQKSS